MLYSLFLSVSCLLRSITSPQTEGVSLVGSGFRLMIMMQVRLALDLSLVMEGMLVSQNVEEHYGL